MYKFSKITNSFYPSDSLSDYSNLPTDLIDVTELQFYAAINRKNGETLDISNREIVVVPATDQFLLTQSKSDKINQITADYKSAIAQPVSYASAGGVVKNYQADANSMSNLQAALLGCQLTQATPTGFAWVAADNTPVPFTYSDLQHLASAIFLRAAEAFALLQAQKTVIRAATTLADVAAINGQGD